MKLNDAYVALTAQLQKVLKTLSAEEAESVASGEIKLAVVRPGDQVLPKSKALDAALKILAGMTAEDRDLVERSMASLKVVRRGGRVVYPINHAGIAEGVSQLDSEAAIIKFLDSDDRLKPTDLRKVAAELGIKVPTSIKVKGDIETYIARHLMAYGMST